MANINTASGNTDTSPSERVRTILLVDDCQSITKAMKLSLSEFGFRVLTAVSAAEAHAVLNRHQVDLIICDNLMTGTFGTELIKQVRESRPDVILIMLSGFLPKQLGERIQEELDVFAVLEKPCGMTQLLQVINEAIKEKQEVAEATEATEATEVAEE